MGELRATLGTAQIETRQDATVKVRCANVQSRFDMSKAMDKTKTKLKEAIKEYKAEMLFDEIFSIITSVITGGFNIAGGFLSGMGAAIDELGPHSGQFSLKEPELAPFRREELGHDKERHEECVKALKHKQHQWKETMGHRYEAGAKVFDSLASISDLTSSINEALGSYSSSSLPVVPGMKRPLFICGGGSNASSGDASSNASPLVGSSCGQGVGAHRHRGSCRVVHARQW